jgi:hypothetical protein
MRLDDDALTDLRDELARVGALLAVAPFPLSTPDREAAVATRDSLERTIREYLVPRLGDPDAPIVAVVAGPGGAGKSTVVNTLAQDRIGETGARRPTTVVPVLWAHRDHASRYWSEFVARVQERVGSAVEVVIGDDQLTANLTLIDTPPIDWEASDGRSPARDVLALADLCVFVTSPTRYADAASWEFLQEVRWRGIPLLFVLNRLPDDDAVEALLLADLAAHLYARELLLEPDPSQLLAVAENPVERWHGGLEPASVGPLRRELAKISDPALRRTVVESNVASALRNLVDRAQGVLAALDEQAVLAARLDRMVDTRYAAETSALAEALAAGSLADAAGHETWERAAADLTGIVTHRAGRAAQATAEAWAEDDLGRALLAGDGRALWRHGHDSDAVEAALQRWPDELEELASGHSRRGRLRPRSRRRVVRRLWPRVLDPQRGPDRRLTRTFGSTLDAVVDAARDSLAGAMGAALEADAARFRRVVDGGAVAASATATVAGVQRITVLADLAPPPSEESPEATPEDPGEDPPEDAEVPDA